MIKVCGRCAKSLPKEQKFCGECGAEAIEVLEPGEREGPKKTEAGGEDERKVRGRDVGARVGHLLFKNSPLQQFGVAAGYMVGRALEGAKVISFSELPPEPKPFDLVDSLLGGGGKKKRKRKSKGKKKRGAESPPRS